MKYVIILQLIHLMTYGSAAYLTVTNSFASRGVPF